MASLFLVLICLLGTASALQIDDDCVVRKSWQRPWLWSETRLSAWVPERETGPFLEFTMIYGDYYLRKYKTKIDAQNANVTLTEGSAITRIASHSHTMTTRGWMDFLYETGEVSTISFNSDNDMKQLVNFTTFDPAETASLTVLGSNVTLNCRSGVRVWNVSGATEFVPLDGSSEYRLSIFSKHEVLPTFTLGPGKFTLSRNGTGITSQENTNNPVSAFVQHNFTIVCKQGGNSLISCHIKLGENQTDNIFYMNESPKFLEVDGRKNDKFYLILRQSGLSQMVLSESRPHITGYSIGANVVLALGIVIGIVGVMLFLGAAFVYRKSRRKVNKNKDKSPFGETNEERIPLVNDIEKGFQVSLKSEQSNALLQAVEEGNANQVEQEMKHVNPKDFPFVEAHLRTNFKILDLFSSHQPSPEELIGKVFQELNNRLEKIFKLAKKGSYRRGVDISLRLYQFPASVRDTNGKGLLHYVASCRDSNGAPLWEGKDIEGLLKDHSFLPNAVDYEGQTCLHTLALAASNSCNHVTWDNKHMKVEEAWIELAILLMNAGCDPLLKDHGGETSDMLAHEKGKLGLRDAFRNHKPNGHHNSPSKHRALHDVIVNCNISKLKKLLLGKTPLLPLQATTDPLTEAIRRRHLEITTLLLSAGAPLCAKSLVSITPLEVAHDATRMWAILPALMRREYANKLRFEASRIKNQDRYGLDLRNQVEILAGEIERNGNNVSWNFSKEIENYNSTAREYLCIAASNGLSLVCQMLGLEDVFLQPLPHEEKPVKKAIENKQWQTLKVLYRDLNMSLFSTIDEKTLSHEIIEEVIDYENKKLHDICGNWKSDVLTKRLDDKSLKDIKEYLQSIAKAGLVSIYHKLKQFEGVPAIDEAIEDFTGYNMLHLAALHGQLNMVEYLLFNKADVLAKGNRNEIALHMAAFGGNSECMNYLQEHMKSKNFPLDAQAFADLTPKAIAEGYEALVEENSPILLPEKHGQACLSNVSASTKTSIILERKGSDFGIRDGESFRNYTKIIYSNKENSSDLILKEIDRLLQQLSKNIPQFTGKRIITNPQGSVPFLTSKASLQVHWEVNSPTYAGIDIKDNGKEPCSLTVTLNNNDDVFKFKDKFHEAIVETLRAYTFSSNYVWLISPCIIKADLGTSVFIAHYDEGKLRFVRVSIIPVFKAKYPEDNVNAVSKLLGSSLKEPFPIHIANTKQNNWIYIVVVMEKEILAQVSDDQRLVLTACTLLKNILYAPWWFPKEESRRHGHSRGYYGFGLAALNERLLRSLFFEEIFNTNQEDWEASRFLDRVISIFRRATCEGGKKTAREVPSFLDPSHSRSKASPIIFSVIEYLEGLQTTDQKIPRAPK